MSNTFYDNEFEKYVKEQADQHRLYPSDQVWRNLHHELHGYKKWPALTFVSIFIISSLVISTILLKPHSQFSATTFNANIKNNNSVERSLKNSGAQDEKNFNNHLSAGNITEQTMAEVIETVHKKQQIEEKLVPAPEESFADEPVSMNSSDKSIPNDPTSITTSDAKPATTSSNAASNNLFSLSFLLRDDITFNPPDFLRDHNSEYSSGSYKFSFANANSNYADDDLNTRFNFSLPNNSSSPLIDLNGSKFDFQFYATPSISYRRLVDASHGDVAKYYISGLPLNANYLIDVNKVIQHKSATGYEVGFGLGYNFSNHFALRSGLQFNVRQYKIDAYVHSSEPASFALSVNNTADVLNTVTGFRNITGSSPIELRSRYYEISLPLTVDWRPVNNKFAWGLAASIQPTYTFDKEPFIISSNYKNYADGSQLMRNWNLNTSIETYLGYNSGKYRLQIGPQVRYQLLPTMNNSYPIREYLVDYGLKIGLIRSLK